MSKYFNNPFVNKFKIFDIKYNVYEVYNNHQLVCLFDGCVRTLLNFAI